MIRKNLKRKARIPSHLDASSRICGADYVDYHVSSCGRATHIPNPTTITWACLGALPWEIVSFDFVRMPCVHAYFRPRLRVLIGVGRPVLRMACSGCIKGEGGEPYVQVLGEVLLRKPSQSWPSIGIPPSYPRGSCYLPPPLSWPQPSGSHVSIWKGNQLLKKVYNLKYVFF